MIKVFYSKLKANELIWRTGSICVPAPIISNYRTNDLVDVKPELVGLVATQLSKELIGQFASGSQLKVAECGVSDFQLITELKAVNVENREYINFFTAQRSNLRKYAVEVEWSLQSKDRKSIVSDSMDEEPGFFISLSNVTYALPFKISKQKRHLQSLVSA